MLDIELMGELLSLVMRQFGWVRSFLRSLEEMSSNG